MKKVSREELKERYGDEEVLVIAKEDLPALAEGFTKGSKKVFEDLFEDTYFIKRWESDYNPEEVEIIPYPILKNMEGNKVFCTKRIEGSNEERLIGNLSLGVGGHVNPAGGMEGIDLINYSLQRELTEELMILPSAIGNTYMMPQGFIRVTDSTVDKDHLGLLYKVAIQDKYCNDLYVKIREADTLEGKFEDIKYLKDNYEKLEEWSKIVVDNL